MPQSNKSQVSQLLELTNGFKRSLPQSYQVEETTDDRNINVIFKIGLARIQFDETWQLVACGEDKCVCV